MEAIRLLVASWFAVTFVATGCAASSASESRDDDAKVSAKTESLRTSYVIDSAVGSVDGISVGMTEARLRESGKPYEVRTAIVEGDEYRVYEVHLAADVHLKCVLSDGAVYSIESTSTKIRDEKGLGVGSQLRELRKAYPAGKFVTGIAEGDYAAFANGTRVIFRFDHHDFKDSCFESSSGCAVDDAVIVQSISIYAPD
jgi:hypothetical protein